MALMNPLRLHLSTSSFSEALESYFQEVTSN